MTTEIEDIGGGPGGQALRTFLGVAHNDDGTLKNQAATILSAILSAGNDAGGLRITDLGAPSVASDAATKAYVDGLAFSAQTLAAVLAAGNSAGSANITNLADPLNAQDAATKHYVDGVTGGSENLAAVLVLGNDAGAVKITNLGAPTVASDAATKTYVDARTLAQILAVGANAGGARIVNLGAPSVSTDAATKAYIDGLIAGLTRTLAQVLAAGLDAGGLVMTNLGTPVGQTDAVPKSYVDCLTPNTVFASTYAPILSDAGKLIIPTNAAGCVVTIPPNASVAYPIWTELHFRAGTTAGTVSIAAGGGVTVIPDPTGTGNNLAAQSARATALKIGTDTWALNGQFA